MYLGEDLTMCTDQIYPSHKLPTCPLGVVGLSNCGAFSFCVAQNQEHIH